MPVHPGALRAAEAPVFVVGAHALPGVIAVEADEPPGCGDQVIGSFRIQLRAENAQPQAPVEIQPLSVPENHRVVGQHLPAVGQHPFPPLLPGAQGAVRYVQGHGIGRGVKFAPENLHRRRHGFGNGQPRGVRMRRPVHKIRGIVHHAAGAIQIPPALIIQAGGIRRGPHVVFRVPVEGRGPAAEGQPGQRVRPLGFQYQIRVPDKFFIPPAPFPGAHVIFAVEHRHQRIIRQNDGIAISIKNIQLHLLFPRKFNFLTFIITKFVRPSTACAIIRS